MVWIEFVCGIFEFSLRFNRKERISFDQIWMSESVRVFIFHLLETIQVELPDEAFKFGVSEEFGKNFGFNFFLIKNVNQSSSLVPCDNVDIGWILR